MKKSLKEELKKLEPAELAARIEVLRREMFSVRLNAATKPVKDKTHFKKKRRDIARALTFLHEKSTLSK